MSEVGRPRSGDAAARAAVALVIGLLFLYLGLPFLAGIANPADNPYGVVWTEGEQAGAAFRYFDLPAGTAWKDAGLFATAVAFLGEALLYGVAVLVPNRTGGLLLAIAALAVLGAIANALAVAMQVRAGFHAPLYALVGLVACGLSAYHAMGHRREIHAFVQ